MNDDIDIREFSGNVQTVAVYVPQNAGAAELKYNIVDSWKLFAVCPAAIIIDQPNYVDADGGVRSSQLYKIAISGKGRKPQSMDDVPLPLPFVGIEIPDSNGEYTGETYNIHRVNHVINCPDLDFGGKGLYYSFSIGEVDINGIIS